VPAALFVVALVVALIWAWPLDRDQTIRDCDFEAAKAIASLQEPDFNVRLMRKREVSEACMNAKGFRRKDGGSDWSSEYYNAWEKRWPWSTAHQKP
jgi:hypothetical protein